MKTCDSCHFAKRALTFPRCRKCLSVISSDGPHFLWQAPKKVMGIKLSMVCYKKRNKPVTQEELELFLDVFIDLVESEGMLCGGGAKLIDINK